jgi:tetratricopeptide (TPR) repeat protein
MTQPIATPSTTAASAPTGAPRVSPPLGVLESSGLIRLATIQPELEYLFRHVLVQDAAYDTLLKQERRRLHVAVAETLESLYPERRDELAAMLAWHYEAAGEPERALPLLIAAGGFALRRYANTEAHGFFRRAFDLLPADSPDPEVQRHRVEIALGMARAGWIFLPASQFLDDLVSLEPVADRLGDPVLIGQLQLWTALMHFQSGERFEPGTSFHRKLTEALETAARTHDGQLRGMALTMVGRSLLSVDPRRSAEALEEAISLTAANDPIGSSLAADSLAMAYAVLGDFARADEANDRAADLARRSGDPKAVIDAQLFRSQVLAERGAYDEAIVLARDGAARATAIGATMCVIAGNMFTGLVELARDRPDDALAPLQISYDLAGQNDAAWWRNISDAGLSSAQCATGGLETARAGWSRSIAAAIATRDPGTEALIRAQRARTLAGTPKPDWTEIAADLEQAAALEAQIGARPREARARVALAVAYDALARTTDAQRERDRAAVLFRELGIAGPRAARGSTPA